MKRESHCINCCSVVSAHRTLLRVQWSV